AASMSRNNSMHFPTNTADIRDTPVMLPPGRAKLATIPVSTVGCDYHDGYFACCLLRRQGARDVERYDHIDLEPHQFGSKLGESIHPSFGGAELVCNILPLHITKFTHSLLEFLFE